MRAKAELHKLSIEQEVKVRGGIEKSFEKQKRKHAQQTLKLPHINVCFLSLGSLPCTLFFAKKRDASPDSYQASFPFTYSGEGCTDVHIVLLLHSLLLPSIPPAHF